MEQRVPDDVGSFIETRFPDWHALFRALVAQRSIFEHEHGIIALVAERIAALDLEVTRVPHEAAILETLAGAQPPISRVPGRCSLVTRVRGRGTGRSLALNTHLDIVSEGDAAAWTHAPFDAYVDTERGVLYGRGAMDDKAGVTIALAVLETLVCAPIRLNGDVTFHFVLEDETTGNGTLLCLKAGYHSDAAVIIDGTRPNRAIDRHAGHLQFRIRLRGRPASVSVSHLGVNAADLIGRLTARLTDAVADLNATRTGVWLRFPSPFQLVVQRVASEGTHLTVPEWAEATCYMTFPPPWTLARSREFLRAETEAFARDRALATIPALMFDGFQTEPIESNATALGSVLNACATQVGYGPVDIGPSTGRSDLRHFAAAGIPCLLYGPGSGFNPHRPDEHYRLEDLPRMIRLFLSLAANWCGPAKIGE